jgi:hypothetical protein
VAKQGRYFTIFGAYRRKSEAVRKEQEGKGRFIVKRRVRGMLRYVVLKPKG